MEEQLNIAPLTCNITKITSRDYLNSCKNKMETVFVDLFNGLCPYNVKLLFMLLLEST